MDKIKEKETASVTGDVNPYEKKLRIGRTI
jgi:hypothetical protein